MAALKKKTKLLPNIASFGYFFLAIPVVLAIISSLWLTATAAYENIKFARGTDQILTLISLVREDASKDPNLAQQPNEDLVEDLIRLAQLQGRPADAWNGAIRAAAISPTIMRIEADLPAHACQRLGVFFGKEADELAIRKMEAREENGIWRQFYVTTDNNTPPPSFPAINAACGKAAVTTLALMLRLR